jgi:hypothetical protein
MKITTLMTHLLLAFLLLISACSSSQKKNIYAEIDTTDGASPGTKVTHIAIVPDAEKGNTVWLQRITDQEYKSFK